MSLTIELLRPGDTVVRDIPEGISTNVAVTGIFFNGSNEYTAGLYHAFDGACDGSRIKVFCHYGKSVCTVLIDLAENKITGNHVQGLPCKVTLTF